MIFEFRIRGRVGRIEEPEEYVGKFAYEISIWDVQAKEMKECFHLAPFDTEEEAIEAGQSEVGELKKHFDCTFDMRDSGETLH